MSDVTSTQPARDPFPPLCPGPVADLVAVYRRAGGGDVVRVVSVDDQADTVLVVLEVAKS